MWRDDGKQVHRNGCHADNCGRCELVVAGSREGNADAQAGDGQACRDHFHPKPSCHFDLHVESFQVRSGINPIVLPGPDPVCRITYKVNVSGPTLKWRHSFTVDERALSAKQLPAGPARCSTVRRGRPMVRSLRSRRFSG